MKLNSLPAVAALLPALLGAACSQGGEGGIPLPRAYPRIPLYDTVYAPLPGVPVSFEANTGAEATAKPGAPAGTEWITLRYPAYGGELFCTFTAATGAEADKAVANRRERMALNAGTNTGQVTTLTSDGGFRAEVVLTPGGSATPVQFVAFGNSHVVSGAFFLEAAVANPDSVRPVIEAVQADVIHAMKHLK